MFKAKELVGKAIVNQATGERMAKVYDLVFTPDTRNVSALVVDSGGWFRDARVVPWGKIVSIGDVIIVQGDKPIIVASESTALQQDLQNDARITGTPIMTDAVERVGTVGDVFINQRGNVVGFEIRQGIVADLTGHKFLPVQHIQTVGKDAIIAAVPNTLPTVKQAMQQYSEQAHNEQAV